MNRDIFTVLEERSKNLDRRHFKDYKYIEENKKQESSYQHSILEGIQTDNLLNQTFFSKANMNIIQNELRFNVHRQTGHFIGKQDETNLVIIMRAIFFQQAKNLPNDIAQQVEELNGKVVESIFPNVLSNIKQYKDYLVNKETIPEPISRSINVSNKGTKQLRRVTTTF